MNPKQVSNNFAVSDQITADDVDTLAEQGYKSIVCNRPDGESPDQPEYEHIARAAAQHDIRIADVPVVSGQLSETDVQQFGAAFDELPKPILAYCRSGTRSITLWSLDQAARGTPAEEIISAGQNAGYDMRGIANLIATHYSS